MQTKAVLLNKPEQISLETLDLIEPGEGDIVVAIDHSGISTGTERLLWSGTMPAFPGMGYPLVPGYEAVGHVVDKRDSSFVNGQIVFVPGANCYQGARGLFGASAALVVVKAARVLPINAAVGEQGVLLALAATALHTYAGHAMPELIVGHGILGRLLARMVVSAGGPPPVVWEINPARQSGAQGYEVKAPDDDPRRDYRVITDVSGDAAILDGLVARLATGGEIVLAGFYSAALFFAFPPAFMREARFRVAAQWQRADLDAAGRLIETGALSLDGLITHHAPAGDAPDAYRTAFNDHTCLKMILDWRYAA